METPCWLTLVGSSRYDRRSRPAREYEPESETRISKATMQILLTNDDGVFAPGLRALRKELLRLGK